MENSLSQLSIQEFLERTASGDPVPGGGSIAALCSAAAAALVQMVAGLTVGKKGYETVQEEMETLLEKSGPYFESAMHGIDTDSDAFFEVMAAFRLPKDTQEKKEFRSGRIQDATKRAALVPLELAENTCKLMQLAETAVEKGNKNALSDAAVAVLLCRTAVLAASYNVRINLSSIKDESFASQAAERIKRAEYQAKELEKSILDGLF